MIRLTRPSQIPAPLRSATARQARRDADEWAQTQLRARRSKGVMATQHDFRPVPGISDSPEVVAVLRGAQHDKCAFCESAVVGSSQGGITRFRPASGAVDTDGASSLPHYAWNAYDWDNLHLTCSACDQAKGLRFPVEGRRAQFGSRGTDLATAEHALLLDPFLDDPDLHLVFTTDGSVSSETPEGRATIDCFALNRRDLVEGRARAAAEAMAEWRSGHRESVVAGDRWHAAARRQAVRGLAEKAAGKTTMVVDEEKHVVVGQTRILKRTDAEEQSAVRAETRASVAQSRYSLADPSANATYFATSKYITAIEISNWKPIRHIAVDVPSGRSERAPWLTFLGENGAGKSSIVQAVALALLGQRGRNSLGLRAGDYVRNGATRAEVKVWLSGVPEPCVITARRSDVSFGGSENAKVLVLGYGATRLLPKRGTTPPPSPPDDTADVQNLFDPFVPMTDANKWLLSLDDEHFSTAARALRRLLDLKESDGLQRFRRAGEVRCRTLGSTVSIERLSDGYQSVLALACDVLSVLLGRWSNVAGAEGIVLLDELGAHLHPRWRMRVVKSLREIFPRVQFIVTTHDPLCLRGLEDGEAALVERLDDEHRTVVVRQDMPPIAGLRADQLLTSELFGLRSTVDPELETAFDEYYALLALRKPTAAQSRRIAALQEQLDGLRLLGNTHRERLVFEAADRWLARSAAATPEAAPARSVNAAVEMLADVWAARSPERFVAKRK